MIRIKDYILNENEIVKIQFDDGSKEMEIDHTNGNRTFIDGTFDDIEWNYGNTESEELKLDYSAVVTSYKKLEEENKKLKSAMQDTYDSANDTCGELQQRIDKAIEYIHNNRPVFELSSKKQLQEWFEKEYYIELLEILKGEENGE